MLTDQKIRAPQLDRMAYVLADTQRWIAAGDADVFLTESHRRIVESLDPRSQAVLSAEAARVGNIGLLVAMMRAGVNVVPALRSLKSVDRERFFDGYVTDNWRGDKGSVPNLPNPHLLPGSLPPADRQFLLTGIGDMAARWADRVSQKWDDNYRLARENSALPRGN